MATMATFVVQVPPGASPGTNLQVQAPSGTVLQVAVPEGVAEGGTFTVADPGPQAAVIGNPANPQSMGGILMANAAQMPQLADDLDMEAYVPFKDKYYDVTNLIESACACLWVPCVGWTSKTLILEDQEVTYYVRNLIQRKRTKMPYAQLGSVEKINQMCTKAIASDFAPVNEKGEGGISPGLGCDDALVTEIVAELQKRKEQRGGIAQMRKLDFLVNKVTSVAQQVTAVLEKLGTEYKPLYPPRLENPMPFTKMVFDVTPICGKMACSQQMLQLEEEEAILTTNTLFGFESRVQKREYNQLGYVNPKKSCICLRAVDSELGTFMPGAGCDAAMVSQISGELQQRMYARGNIGQIKKQERIVGQVKDIANSMPILVEKLGVAYPPEAQVMTEVFRKDVPDLSMLESQGVKALNVTEQVEPKQYEITNKIESCCTCCFTCGTAGCTKQTAELGENELIIKEKNNWDDSVLKMPYGQLESVDMQKSCCCFYGVNGISPGYGCNKGLVEELSRELHTRRLKRGNIAQLKQLEAMHSSVALSEAMGSLVISKEGLAYPPTQETMSKLYGERVPRVVRDNQESPHVDPVTVFQYKKYDVTNYIECFCSFLCCPCTGCMTRTLELEPDEFVLTSQDTFGCNVTHARSPYAQLGSVDEEVVCCCCHAIPDIATPGFGCSADKVKEILGDLQERKVKRGNIAQLQLQENLITMIMKLGVKMDILLDKHGVPKPALPQASPVA
eukprot:TRINITY_DN98685_c0_g1_i1.p1 TRINITY_DN98685_c0_g1~~TRINITY_DN98685_c0_g1_i1.p1  ORF type:complete len:734 (-),score=156.32 TRINITY_DN98685_c0_g1_i1:176-2377(-)